MELGNSDVSRDDRCVQHRWTINDFPTHMLQTPAGVCLESSAFRNDVNDDSHDWTLRIYPNGSTAMDPGKVAVHAAEQPAAAEAKQTTPVHAVETIAFRSNGTAEFCIKNEGQKSLIFKVKGNDPGAMEIQPDPMGIILPASDLELQIKLRREVVGPLLKEEYKLLVQVAEVSENIDEGRLAAKTEKQLREIWNESEKAASVHNTKITISTEAVPHRLNEQFNDDDDDDISFVMAQLEPLMEIMEEREKAFDLLIQRCEEELAEIKKGLE